MWEEWDEPLIITFYVSTAGQGVEDDYSQELFFAGWIDQEGSPDDRWAARELFFEWMIEHGVDPADFDWIDWAEWYESVSG